MPTCFIRKNIGVAQNIIAPGGGEWLYPAAGPRTCCCCAYPGDPQDSTEVTGRSVILWFHGGAYALLTAGSLRETLSRVAESTETAVLAINYRRAPEHSHPGPVEDCVETYAWLLKNGYHAKNITVAGDRYLGHSHITTSFRRTQKQNTVSVSRRGESDCMCKCVCV